MKEFPQVLNINNKNNFDSLLYMRMLCYLRRDIYEHMIRCDENDYFDIQHFSSKNKLKSSNVKNMIEQVIQELMSIGWKCKLSFGGTALFIYSDELPKSCWDDGLI